MKPINVIKKLNESNYYYKEFSGAGEIDYVEFETEQEACDYAEKVNKETGNETAVYRIDNDECVSLYDAKDNLEEGAPLDKEKYIKLMNAIEDIVYSINGDRGQLNDLLQDIINEFKRYVKESGGKLTENDDLDDLALWVYKNTNRDNEWDKFTDDELVQLISYCCITNDNPGGRAYDDEVFDAAERRPNGDELIKKGQELAKGNKNGN